MHLCSISEVVKPSSKMTLLYPKIASMWQVQINFCTLLWQFFNTHKLKRNIYYLLLYSNTFQDRFKIGRALPSAKQKLWNILQIKFKMAECLLRYWKKLAPGMVLQKFILVNLICLYKDNLKRTVFMML